jgi:hypothetical protein
LHLFDSSPAFLPPTLSPSLLLHYILRLFLLNSSTHRG